MNTATNQTDTILNEDGTVTVRPFKPMGPINWQIETVKVIDSILLDTLEVVQVSREVVRVIL